MSQWDRKKLSSRVRVVEKEMGEKDRYFISFGAGTIRTLRQFAKYP